MNAFYKICAAAGAVLLNLACACQMHAQAGALDTDPALKLHFDFDENFTNGEVVDVTGNGNNGWQFNPTNWITATNGVFGGTAAQFTYVGLMSNDYPHIYPFSQYIAVTNLAGFAYLTNATISFWAKFGTNTDLAMVVMDNGYNVNYAAGGAALASNSWTISRTIAPYLSFTVYPATGGGTRVVSWPNDVVRSGGSTPDLSTTQMHLYTLTLDCPSNMAVAYYDGAPYMAGAINLPWIRIYGCASIRWLCIGAMSHDGTPQWGDDRYPNSAYFVGRMDGVRIYNRTLSPAEVKALYTGSVFAQNLGIRNTGSQSVQVGWSGNSNTQYQVEYQPSLSGTNWSPLGSPLAGNGGTNSIVDPIADQPAGFYRVRVLPLPLF